MVFLAGLACASGDRSPAATTSSDSAAALSPLPARPRGDITPEKLLAWRRTDAEWARWTDPSRHKVLFVTVAGRAAGDSARPVRLEVGHSIAGAEITRFAARWPDRVDKLVYLDSAHDFDGYDKLLEGNPSWPPPVKLRPGTRNDSLSIWRDWGKRDLWGFWSNAMEVDRVRTAWYTTGQWFYHLDPQRDSLKWKEASRWVSSSLRPFIARGNRRFLDEMPNGRLIYYDSDHYVFLFREERTLADIRQFLGRQ